MSHTKAADIREAVNDDDQVLDDIEVEEVSEPENVIDDIEAGSSDDEFIDVQEKKKLWISMRNNSGKNHIMRQKKHELEKHTLRGVKDDYWGEDEQGLVPTIAKLLPDAEHRLCARHIFTNWTKVVKGAPLHKLFWRAVKSYTEEGFNDAMKELQQRSPKAHAEMCSRDVKRFCRCFYKKWACTGVTCNNMAETFNSWILEPREKPILTMLEEIRQKVMSRMVDKKVQPSRCNDIVTPRVRAIINDHMQGTRNWKAIEASKNVYEVHHVHNSTLTYAVRLDESSCTCRYWDVNGIPCEHATTTICSKNENPDSYVAYWYSKEAYETSYKFSLEPLNGQSMWKKVDGSPILPSDPRVKYGRPPNKRKRSFGETKRKAYTYRIPKKGQQLCSNCKEPGHKSRTCKYKVAVDESQHS